MDHADIQRRDGHRSYLIGFTLAVILTLIPFGLVWSKALTPAYLVPVIALLAAIQMLVHLRYFLHLGLRSTPWETKLAGGLAVILIFLLVAGTLWIMFDANMRMMTMTS